MTRPHIEAFFDEPTNTISYLVGDPTTRTAAIIDPVLDFDLASGVADTRSAERILAFASDQDWRVEMVLETHAHADHLSAAPFIKAHTDAWIGIGTHIRDVQRIFRPVFAMTDLKTDGSDFDRLFEDGDRFAIGALEVEVLHVPGHTPADIAYRIGDTAFVGDTLFMPDSGSARADFPGGDAGVLYDSIRKVLALPDAMRLFMCHDYGPNGRDIRWETTVGEEKADNIHIGGGRSREDFVAMREARDATLEMPRLILPSLQVNMRGGRLPEADADDRIFLKLPINAL